MPRRLSRPPLPPHTRRSKEYFPPILILQVIGAGQSGLEIAARLKYLGIKTLIIEKKPRVGDLWRSRYEALCLHDTVCRFRPPVGHRSILDTF